VSPTALRMAALVIACQGIAAVGSIAVAYLVSVLLALALALFVLFFGLVLEVIAEKAQRAHELDVERVRREKR
jgi:hypothetical protein